MSLERSQVSDRAARISRHTPLFEGVGGCGSFQSGYHNLAKSRTVQGFRRTQAPPRSIFRGSVYVGDQKDVHLALVKSREMHGRSKPLRKLDQFGVRPLVQFILLAGFQTYAE
jgi:hypothetical protein